MSKLLKRIFSRLVVVLLLISIQIVAVVWFINEAREYYYLFNIIFVAISLIFAIKVLKNDLPSATKIPLLIMLLVFPISGIFLYYFSLENRMRKKLVKNYKNQTFTLESLYVENPAIQEQLLNENKEIYKESQYIANNTYLPVYMGNQTRYFPNGELLFRSVLKDLRQAKDFIFIEFFIIGTGVLWDSILTVLKQKVREGVEVRVIFDDVGSYKTLPYKYNQKLESMGIKCVVFNPIIPAITASHNNRDHKKIIVIDGRISYTGGANIADEYINKKQRFGYWKDNGIRIVGDATKSFTLMFLETWHYYQDSAEDCSLYLNIAPPILEHTPGYIQPYMGDPMLEANIVKNVYMNVIHNASEYIYIATPYLSLDQEFIEALANASKRGVTIKLVIPHIPDKKYIYYVTESFVQDLFKYSIEAYEYIPGFIHSKMIVADDKIATVGTANFDYRSFYHNYECGVWLYETDSILDIKNDFETIFSKSKPITETSIKKNKHPFKYVWGEFLKIFAPLF